MNLSYYIAKRYFKTKKSKNIINLISKISVIGITVSTAALVILLSAFNGIEQMVVKLYTDFDADLTIASKKGKTFNENFIDFNAIKNLEGVKNISRAVEEVVILKHGDGQGNDKWVNAKLLGIDSSFLSLSKMQKHILAGEARLYEDNEPLALFGAGLLNKLDGYIGQSFFKETITFHVPLREGKIKPGRTPLSIRPISVAGTFNFNREVNNDYVVLPFNLARELLKYKTDLTNILIDVNDNSDLEEVKENLQHMLPVDFEVKTNFEKNELIFKTSKSERIIVLVILLFIFVLASFNLIASITMLYVEKKDDLKTLYSMGVTKQQLSKVFFLEGLMISGKGIILGLGIGYVLTLTQVFFSPIKMPNTGGEAFPMQATISDALLIIFLSTILGIIASYVPTKFLFRKHSKQFFFEK